jgi:hypothetical protein
MRAELFLDWVRGYVGDSNVRLMFPADEIAATAT